MTSNRPPLSIEDVLDLFLMEEEHGAEVLARYVRAYPEFAVQLIDLSRLIASSDVDNDRPLSATDQSRIDAAWIAHAAAGPANPPNGDPFTALSGDRSKALSLTLGIPRQVITCFRERKIDPSSVPNPILQRFADELDVPLAHVIAAMRQSAQPSMGRSYKAVGKPGAGGQVSFEQVLIDAGVPEADRARLLAGDD